MTEAELDSLETAIREYGLYGLCPDEALELIAALREGRDKIERLKKMLEETPREGREGCDEIHR